MPDKEKAFAEIYRILNPNGHFCISDIVILGELPEGLRKSASMYAGCISGALQKDEYLSYISKAGFSDIEVKRTVRNNLPDELLREYLNEDEIKAFREKDFGIFSITVTGIKK